MVYGRVDVHRYKHEGRHNRDIDDPDELRVLAPLTVRGQYAQDTGGDRAVPEPHREARQLLAPELPSRESRDHVEDGAQHPR